MSAEEWEQLSIEAGKVFTPATPVNEQQLFAGRKEQLQQVVEVVNQKGQHAIIFGERGVGKTSLANVIVKRFEATSIIALRKNCDSSDDYSGIWKKVFSEIDINQKTRPVGFLSEPSFLPLNLGESLGKEVKPEQVRKILTMLSEQCRPIIIIDEFDRVSSTNARAATADTIKALSDHGVMATVILVGVADSVEELIKEHLSIERAMVQIKMPRMSSGELGMIIKNGLDVLQMTIDEDAKKHIATLSQGLPHYTHLLSLHSTRQALDRRSMNIELDDVQAAISKALQQAQETIKRAYHKAIMSPRKDNLFKQVLLACALARTDDLGYFAASDVREPLSRIMKKTYEIPSYSRHLNDFCEAVRGPILQKIGAKRRFRFRFVNPLMQPHVTMQGLNDWLIDRQVLEFLKP